MINDVDCHARIAADRKAAYQANGADAVKLLPPLRGFGVRSARLIAGLNRQLQR